MNRQPLLLIRHAHAEHSDGELMGGWTDTELTENGLRQARLLAERLGNELAGIPLQLFSGNLRRARHTAEIVGQALGIEAQALAGLSDLNIGAATGKTQAEAAALYNPPSEPLLDWQPYPGAETWRQFHRRVTNFMEAFYPRLEHPTILVTHAATIHVIVAWWLRLPIEALAGFKATPASLSVLCTTSWGERAIERLNDTAHIYAAGNSNPIQL